VWAQNPKANAPKAPELIVMKDAALGSVAFPHKAHEGMPGVQCEICHHASKPEKPETRPNQACRDCHTKPPAAGMKTSRQAAFHNSTAQSGVCVNCHKRELAAGKKPPLKCAECHRKEARKVAGGRYGQPWHPAPGVHALGLGGHGADSVP
ncbi:MAG: cytochrome c3 family protein, partial [Bryobacteraceae bacterium]